MNAGCEHPADFKRIKTDKKRHPNNCHKADWVFGRGWPHKINNFDETWVENGQPGILMSYKFFHVNATGENVWEK